MGSLLELVRLRWTETEARYKEQDIRKRDGGAELGVDGASEE